jgi:hypothetical protein
MTLAKQARHLSAVGFLFIGSTLAPQAFAQGVAIQGTGPYDIPRYGPASPAAAQPSGNPQQAPQPGAPAGFGGLSFPANAVTTGPQGVANSPLSVAAGQQMPPGTAPQPGYPAQPGYAGQQMQQPGNMPPGNYGTQPGGFAPPGTVSPATSFAPLVPVNRAGSNQPGMMQQVGSMAPQPQQPNANPIATTVPSMQGMSIQQVQHLQAKLANKPSNYAAPTNTNANAASLDSAAAAQPGEHPLVPAITWAKRGLAEFEKVKDYSCTLVKRERIDGTLNEHEYLFVKVRQHPRSIYIYFLSPAKVKGQEVLFVEGQNDGNMLAHPNGLKHKMIGTVSLNPTGMMAMAGNRYPVTELGIRRLLERLIEVGEHDMQFGECEVKFIEGAKISGRECTCIQVVHPTPRKEFIFNMARIFVDKELDFPIRYEAYDWSKEPGGAPLLIEEYTYMNLKVNNGFTDQDFDRRNPNYQFQ